MQNDEYSFAEPRQTESIERAARSLSASSADHSAGSDAGGADSGADIGADIGADSGADSGADNGADSGTHGDTKNSGAGGRTRKRARRNVLPYMCYSSVLASVGGQASPGFGLGVLVTSPPAEKHPKSRFPDVPGGPARRPRDVRDVTC